MGLGISNLISKLSGRKRIQILIASLDGAGKTAILYNLKLGYLATTIPTIGFNVEDVDYNNLRLTMWDFGGGDKIQPLWKKMYKDLKLGALIFVVDSNDRERIREAADKLHSLVTEDYFHDTAVLLFANKQDLPDSMSPVEIAEEFKLNELLKNHPWQIQASSAVTKKGLNEGLAWLANELCKKSTKK